MSEFAMRAPRAKRQWRFAELMICLPHEWPLQEASEDNDHPAYWPLFWLTTLARAPHEFGVWFGADHTIPNGDPPEPVADDVQFCCWMLRLPKTTPQEFHALKAGRKTIHFYGLVPIYREEMEFALENGHEALAARLDVARVTELLNIGRASVVGREDSP